MKAKGQLSITVPGWYITQKPNMLDPNEVYSSQSMIDEDSVPTFKTEGIKIYSFKFDPTNRFMLITYTAPADISSEISLSISKFRNPVNQRPKSGFVLKTSDENGFLINFSEK